MANTKTVKEEKKANTKQNAKTNAKANANANAKANANAIAKEDVSHVYHVSMRKEDKKWKVFNAGSEKVIKLFDTQKEAIDYATTLVKNYNGSLVIHMLDGKIRKQNYSK